LTEKAKSETVLETVNERRGIIFFFRSFEFDRESEIYQAGADLQG
jgi:hypothetical protein